MNPEQPPITSAEPVVPPKTDWKRHFFTVTPLSKALAMLLFIALPFFGFWLGMNYPTIMDSFKEPQVVFDDSPFPPVPESEQLSETQSRLGTTTEVSNGRMVYQNKFYQFTFGYPSILLHSTSKSKIPDTESSLSIQESISPDGKLVLFVEGINSLRSPSVSVSKNESNTTQEQVYQECIALPYGQAEIIPWGDAEGVSCVAGEMPTLKVTVVTPSFLYVFGTAGYWKEGGIDGSLRFARLYAPIPTIHFVTPGKNNETWKLGTIRSISWKADIEAFMKYALREAKDTKWVEEELPSYAIRLREANSPESGRYIVGSAKNNSFDWTVGEVIKSYGEGDESPVTLKPGTYYLEIHFAEPLGLLPEPLMVTSPMFTISD